jgi:aerobic carbon-monoxide dehydrogenase medium subunit
MTAVLALLGGTVELARVDGSRTVGAEEFFVGPMESCANADELATSAFFPRLPARTGTAIREVSRRNGDYALCGVAAAVTLEEDGRIARAWAAYLGVSSVPCVLELTPPLADADPASADWRAAGRLAAEGVEPGEDIHAGADYRCHLVEVLTARALAEAAHGVRAQE